MEPWDPNHQVDIEIGAKMVLVGRDDDDFFAS